MKTKFYLILLGISLAALYIQCSTENNEVDDESQVSTEEGKPFILEPSVLVKFDDEISTLEPSNILKVNNKELDRPDNEIYILKPNKTISLSSDSGKSK